MAMHKQLTLLSLVGVLALALTGCQAQIDATCGREGQDPCDGAFMCFYLMQLFTLRWHPFCLLLRYFPKPFGYL